MLLEDNNSLPQLTLSGELVGGDVENLSNNLESGLKLEREQQLQQQQQNDLNEPGFQRQSSQLHTPDVSSMSVDGVKRSMK